MSWKTLIFQIIFIAVVFMVGYRLLKKYVLVKIHPNKIVILSLAIISFLLPGGVGIVLKKNMGSNSILQYVSSGLFVIFFLWFLDLHNGVMYGRGKNKANDIKIKPKAKPNRANKNFK
ncbi:MAG: hypothetical protein LKE46_11900 [Clostridium sp.]|jgi:preprotein translocase subunit SecG|uniref:hypothetical protein n=1 Tax=Clostridium sp. TaxID=1506 RepID=UPI0025BC55BC|nr:hypothetical protein [Clostridium sp.]MCH3964967.1 hypothetical protein [Clostridium sp.]MCI1716539.1 hypothetical protein [Clostridium sp.]MCI1800979.1 hypothetical protein [Clostridium sp.]MCI1814716.1 hypothetical protein [Clostridium sp.]MCI1871726.1 hypothetical protein [Clostridium sp.]